MEVNGYDFDEDLSELEEDKEQERDDIEQVNNEGKDDQDYECSDEDSDCDCNFEDDDIDEDDESERSYGGSDADYYYELKDEHDERKQEKLRERKEKERSLNKAEKERRTIPVGLLAGQSSRLFCSDHVDLFFSDFYATKRVDFYYLDTNIPCSHKQKPGSGADMLHGDVYLGANGNCNFGPSCPPEACESESF